ncbi:hypothetical protein AURDEDRAFT_163501 [Auricularia subglabra TFB-10046 SS5]|nr:hypothetical protein AURDEDRAFT_163501 [Auricularia subglabra TFB-10046 SS5]
MGLKAVLDVSSPPSAASSAAARDASYAPSRTPSSSPEPSPAPAGEVSGAVVAGPVPIAAVAATCTLREAAFQAATRPAVQQREPARQTPPHQILEGTSSRAEVSQQLGLVSASCSAAVVPQDVDETLYELGAASAYAFGYKPLQDPAPNEGDYDPAGPPRRPPLGPPRPGAGGPGGGNGGGGGGGGGSGGGGNGGYGLAPRYRPFPGGSGDDGGGGAPAPAAAAGVQDVVGLRIDTKFRPESLPAWDGDTRTALEYFDQLRDWAEMGGSIPVQLGAYAPLQWKGAAKQWWSAIALQDRDAMCHNVVTLIAGIRDGFLSQSWVRDLMKECNATEYREAGHTKEDPAAYLRRRAQLVNALYDFTEEEQVSYMLSRAPVQWLNILGDQQIFTITDLLLRAAELRWQLEQAAITDQDMDERIDRAVSRALRAVGKQYARRGPAAEPTRDGYQRAPPARAYLSNVDGKVDLIDLGQPDDDSRGDPDDVSYDEVAFKGVFKTTTVPTNPTDLAQARRIHAFLAAKRKPPPVKGYQHERDDHVSNPPPPFDCRFCRGKHWHRECKHNSKVPKNSAMLAAHELSLDEYVLYSITEDSALMPTRSVYDCGVDEGRSDGTERESPYAPQGREASQGKVEEALDRWDVWNESDDRLGLDDPVLIGDQPPRKVYREDSPRSVHFSPAERELRAGSEMDAPIAEGLQDPLLPVAAAEVNFLSAHGPRSTGPTFEIDSHRNVLVVDDEFDVWYCSTPKAKEGLLEPDGDGFEERHDRDRTAFPAALNAVHVVLPPKEIELTPRRRPPNGHSSVGIGVLSVTGRVGSADQEPIVLRLDSGASISLIAEEYLKTLIDPPRVRTGLRIEIAQLTDQSPRIKGYVQVPVRISAEGGGIPTRHAAGQRRKAQTRAKRSVRRAPGGSWREQGESMKPPTALLPAARRRCARVDEAADRSPPTAVLARR